jgi:ribonuclease P protein component
MPKLGIETVSNAELHSAIQFAWQKLQRLAQKHQNTISPHKNRDDQWYLSCIG